MEKVALVTGGSRGIGKAIAMELAQRGYNIAITYQKEEQKAQGVISDLRRLGVKGIMIQADLANPQTVQRVFQTFDQYYSHLDVLINNAGWTQYIPHDQLDALTEDIFDKILNIHLKSVFLCSREAMHRMQERDGCIINITSIAGYNGVGSNIAYCAAKAGVICMTKSLARALGPNIRVNSVAPGLTETEMTLSAPSHYREEQVQITPLDRLATPDDIAQTVISLIHDMTFVNGKTIVIDGGRLS